MSNTELFLFLIERTKQSESGWWTIFCPACFDTKRSGSFLVTPTGGFRYKCWHRSCAYHLPTGWEPESPIGNRVVDLYLSLGGDLDDLDVGQNPILIKRKLQKRYEDDIRETLQMINGGSR
jgi:hypothetical protein